GSHQRLYPRGDRELQAGVPVFGSQRVSLEGAGGVHRRQVSTGGRGVVPRRAGRTRAGAPARLALVAERRAPPVRRGRGAATARSRRSPPVLREASTLWMNRCDGMK